MSNPKGINRKKLVSFVLLIKAQRGSNEKIEYDRYGQMMRADTIGLFLK